ncbi:MAG: carbohydrate kinase family protein [Atribacterota bacterium]
MVTSFSKEERKGIVVIGGANIDIKGKPNNVIQWDTSNPGTIRVSHGGVGRNIAHYLGLLNIPVDFLSAVGDDDEGREILEKLRNVNVQAGEVILSKKDPTGKYVALLDEKGDLQAGISDTEIMKRVTPRYLIAKTGIIKKNCFVIIDTNLTPQSIYYIADLCNREEIPLIADPVSAVKSRKLLGVLSKINYLTPDISELGALSGVIIKNATDRQKAINMLMKKGVKNIVLTHSSRGVYIHSEQVPEGEFINIRRKKMVDCTGAGDALVAGMAYGLYNNYGLYRAVQIGITIASLAVTSPDTVYTELDEVMVKKQMVRTFRIL